MRLSESEIQRLNERLESEQSNKSVGKIDSMMLRRALAIFEQISEQPHIELLQMVLRGDLQTRIYDSYNNKTGRGVQNIRTSVHSILVWDHRAFSVQRLDKPICGDSAIWHGLRFRIKCTKQIGYDLSRLSQDVMLDSIEIIGLENDSATIEFNCVIEARQMS